MKQQSDFEQTVWQLEAILPEDVLPLFMEVLEDGAESMSCFKDEEKLETWKLVCYHREVDAIERLRMLTLGVAEKIGLPTPVITLEALPDTDWVSESQKHFSPMDIGRFHIYASWHENGATPDQIPLQIDPQRAFGTGGHETTSGCLDLLQRITKDFTPKRILDMGCGSGILAMGAAFLWPDAEVIIAADIDPVCVETTDSNLAINGLTSRITSLESDGYHSTPIAKHAPYDLIISNILAQPLIEFAPTAAANLVAGGRLVLSGILDWQEQDVLAAHTAQGLRFLDRIQNGKWPSLILGK